MARTRSISDERILTAARKIFIERGPSASTADIAADAGISEGTIFKRFGTKAELFERAMGFPPLPPIMAEIPARIGKGEVRDTVLAMAEGMLGFFDQIVPVFFVMASCHGMNPTNFFEELEHDPPPVIAIKAITGFFELEQKLGRLPGVNPEVMARSFIGGLFHYAFAEHSGLNRLLPLERDAYLNGLVDLLLGSASPASE